MRHKSHHNFKRKVEDGNPGMYMAPLLPPPHCASKLIMRSDDTEEVVKRRLRIYNEMVLFLHLWSVLFHNFKESSNYSVNMTETLVLFLHRWPVKKCLCHWSSVILNGKSFIFTSQL